MNSFWIIAAGNLFTGIAYLTLSILVYWISRQSKFRFNFILLCFSAFAAVRSIGYFFEAYSSVFPIGAWLITGIYFAVGLCVAAIGIWTFRRRHAVVTPSSK